MAYRLSKKFRFEAAHRLALNYCGKCANIHGHSWNGQLQISGPDLDSHGFLMDFADMKLFTKEIENQYDHKLLLQKDDVGLIELCAQKKWEVVVFENNPTSETLAKELFIQAQAFFTKWPGIKVDYIKIEETCTSECVYDGE